MSEESNLWTTYSNALCHQPINYLPNIIHNSGIRWSESDGSFFYSAYYDFRSNSVAVISILPKHITTFYCLLWFTNEKHVWIGAVSTKVIPDTHNKNYYVAVYQCDNPFNQSLPYAITMTKNPCAGNYNATIKIVYNQVKKPKEKHWCLSPLFKLGSINLSESLALHKVIGVDKATIFVVNDVLRRKLNKISWVNAIRWSIPVSRSDIHYFGQCAAMNDCLYRNMFTAKYMIFTDLDEIFTSRRSSNILLGSYSKFLWREMDLIQEKHNNTLGTFYSQSALFPTPFNFKGIASLKITKRYQARQDNRKKFIIVPNRIDVVGIHYAFPIKNYNYVYIQEKVVVLHHYRRCRKPEIECLGYRHGINKVIEDKFILQLQGHLNGLIGRYKNILNL